MTCTTSAATRFRAPEILSVFKDHGQLTARTLNKMISPQMSHKKLVRALDRLLDKGVIDKRGSDFPRPYYFLSQAAPARTECASILNCEPDQLIQPLLKRKDWYHQELCEYWIFQLKKLFPQAEVVRDREILKHEMASNIMFTDRDGFDLFPDFLLIFPRVRREETVAVAVEIERTRKSNERLMRKLRSYMNATRVDGLLYVCDSGRLSDTIRMLYEKQTERKAIRSSHYSEYYFLFSDSIDTAVNPLERIFSANGKRVNLDEWIIPLLDNKWTLRRPAMFERRGELTPSYVK